MGPNNLYFSAILAILLISSTKCVESQSFYTSTTGNSSFQWTKINPGHAEGELLLSGGTFLSKLHRTKTSDELTTQWLKSIACPSNQSCTVSSFFLLPGTNTTSTIAYATWFNTTSSTIFAAQINLSDGSIEKAVSFTQSALTTVTVCPANTTFLITAHTSDNNLHNYIISEDLVINAQYTPFESTTAMECQATPESNEYNVLVTPTTTSKYTLIKLNTTGSVEQTNYIKDADSSFSIKLAAAKKQVLGYWYKKSGSDNVAANFGYDTLITSYLSATDTLSLTPAIPDPVVSGVFSADAGKLMYFYGSSSQSGWGQTEIVGLGFESGNTFRPKFKNDNSFFWVLDAYFDAKNNNILTMVGSYATYDENTKATSLQGAVQVVDLGADPCDTSSSSQQSSLTQAASGISLGSTASSTGLFEPTSAQKVTLDSVSASNVYDAQASISLVDSSADLTSVQECKGKQHSETKTTGGGSGGSSPDSALGLVTSMFALFFAIAL